MIIISGPLYTTTYVSEFIFFISALSPTTLSSLSTFIGLKYLNNEKSLTGCCWLTIIIYNFIQFSRRQRLRLSILYFLQAMRYAFLLHSPYLFQWNRFTGLIQNSSEYYHAIEIHLYKLSIFKTNIHPHMQYILDAPQKCLFCIFLDDEFITLSGT